MEVFRAKLNIPESQAIRVKVCGITNVETLRRCDDLGVNAIGFLLGEERVTGDGSVVGHRISTDRATEIARQVPEHMTSVMLVHDQEVNNVIALAHSIIPTALQLQIDMGPEAIGKLRDSLPDIKIIKTLHVYPDSDKVEVLCLADSFLRLDAVDAILLDSRISTTSRQTGGTGVTHDWGISAFVVDKLRNCPVILAGGLRPDNVGRAISRVKPYAVDVMTGVEKSKGVKDWVKIESFVRAARAA